MMDPATAYFLKKYYPHVIKWWLVAYNPEAIRIWPSKQEEEEALRIEAEEAELLALEDSSLEDSSLEDSSQEYPSQEIPALPGTTDFMGGIDESAFNATTGSYSGLYGQQPVDADTQAALEAILYASSNQSSVDSLLAGGAPSSDIIIPPEQDEIIREANEIYERLLREAAEDEAKKQAEIDEMRRQADERFSQ